MIEVLVYTRADCHLCDEAKAVIEREREAGLPIEVRMVDIDLDPALRALYTDEVPVVFVAGRKAFKYRVDPRELVLRVNRARKESVDGAL